MYIYALVPRRGRIKTGLGVENPFVFKCLKVRKVPTGDACLDTSQHSVGSSEVLRSASRMTANAESRMNPEDHLMVCVTDESPALGFHGLCSCLRWDLNHVLVKGSRAGTKRGAGLPNLTLWSRKSLGSGRFKSSERLCEPSRYLCVPRSRSVSPAFLASRRTVSCLPEGTWLGGWGLW